ncbi:MAG: hypothetical protein COW79_14605 [Bdellovibrionales bacterium CG22_combo_CG10-13_8_21_14_all_38_13]|nr:MAG: hypothetical protein COW79_14605 [Bdellovibrionales bacterium CG22_combo_CG10-13_8_21_14_all_38_13]
MKILIIFLLSTSAFAQNIEIKAWYKLDRFNDDDSSAEVCYTLTPATSEPSFVEITVDSGYKSEAIYSSWIGSKGSNCHVVSTRRGRVKVDIPALKISTQSDIFNEQR